jgi:integrase
MTAQAPAPPSPSAGLIEAHRVSLQARKLSLRTVTDACELLYRVDRGLACTGGLTTALPHELESWLASSPGWSAWTVATYHQHLRRFYKWATRRVDPWLTYDPSEELQRPRPRPPIPDPATDDQVIVCLTQARWPWRLHCQLAAWAGLRPIEIASLCREHVSKTHIRVLSGKGDKPAILPTHPKLWKIIEPLPAGPVTHKASGEPADAHWVSIQTGAYLRKTLKAGTSLRHLRHWYATWLLDNGYTIREVQELMRHSSIVTTQGYTFVKQDRLRQAIQALPDFGAAEDGPFGDGTGRAA